MKIALCFSGQLRTWERCYPTWFKMIKMFESEYDAEVDIFMHSWDFNSDSTCIVDGGVSDGPFAVSKEEQEKVIDILKPKAYHFENEEKSKDVREKIIAESKRHEWMYGKQIYEWIGSPFYSMMYAAHLKKKYEFDNSFKYDVCIRMRYDLFFDDKELSVLFQKHPWVEFEPPTHNTCYSCHSGPIDQFPFYRVGDVFFLADSVTFDRICDFYRWLPILGEKAMGPRDVLVEQGFCYYIKMLRMDIKRLYVDPKIARTHDYKDKLKMLRRELSRSDI